MKFILLFLTLINLLSITTSCKGRCDEETWTIEGRLLQGTTFQPIKNVIFTAELYDKNILSQKVSNVTPIGKVITDDSGYFKIEYPCQGKDFDWIDFETEAPYGGYVRDNVPFEKHFKRTFYYSTMGKHEIYLKESEPLNGDTLFVGLRESVGTGSWYKQDTFTSNASGLWSTIKANGTGGYGFLFACRGSELYKSIINPTTHKYEDKYWWRIQISGDPIIDTTVAQY